MQRLLTVFLLLLVASRAASAAENPAPKPNKPERPLKVLFIGNSYTAANNLPAMLAGLAEAGGGRKIEAAAELKGGATLEQHFKETKAIERIRQHAWDVVVLQEQSLRPAAQPAAMHEFGRKLHDEARQRGAQTVLYLTWARQDKPDMQDALNRAYFELAKETGANVAPVGMAWRAALAADEQLELHVKDKSHPTPAGTYLAACVFYATLLDKSPEGLPAEVRRGDKLLVKLDAELAGRLQKTAWKLVREVKDRPPKAKWAWEQEKP
jgi:hypothetical protein